MPTRDRPGYVLQSIRYFQGQDYPARELVIVDDGAQDLSGQLPSDPRIRYLHISPGLSIGAKRNRACELARGSIIAQWDDDDWYAPGRLTAQVAPLVSQKADITALPADIFFELPRWEFWRCTPELHRRLFVHDVHGGTLVYRRRIWEQMTQYPDASLAEDAAFLSQAVRRGARLVRLANNGLFIYLRHGSNSWSFACGHYLDSHGWRRVSEPPLPPEDLAFYASLSPAAPAFFTGSPTQQAEATHPLVTCIMPTCDRRYFVPKAVAYFLRQDYPNKELLIIDDGLDPVIDLLPKDPAIRYLRLDHKKSLGAKRNLACQEAKGEIIAHWDDDDWMASWRLRYQVENLLQRHADICGLDKVLYFDPSKERSWQYIYPPGGRSWVAGNTLCYRKCFWRENPFPDINVGEDTLFQWSRHQKRILALQEITFYVALIHNGNISPKKTTDCRWHPYPIEEIRKLMGEDWKLYGNLSSHN